MQLRPGAPSTPTARWMPDPDPDLRFAADPDVEPGPGQAPRPGDPARGRRAPAGRTSRHDWGIRRHAVQPVHEPRDARSPRSTACCWSWPRSRSWSPCSSRSFLARRFTTPITRLTEASRRLAEGDLVVARRDRRAVVEHPRAARRCRSQFNQMADRLEESVGIIRRDRDCSRDFLADVSHELRTPIAAMRTFMELLQGPAGRGPGGARRSSSTRPPAQLDRLDWLAQNLLELSKLDSGLVLLDLRPDDVRGTIESAVEQQLRDRGAARDRRSRSRSPTARCGSATTRRGSGRSSPTSSATRSSSRSPGGQVRIVRPAGARRRRADRGRSTRASASSRRSCPGSSTASTAAPRRTRRAARAPAWASRS